MIGTGWVGVYIFLMTLTPDAVATAATAPVATRIGGLDIARGIAILGMFWAHLEPMKDYDGVAGVASQIPHGRSAILFALIAGVSIVIMTGGRVPRQGSEMLSSRMRLVGRALFLFLLGSILASLTTPIAVILGYYGFWLLLAIPFTHWGAKRLAILAAVLAVVGPTIVAFAMPVSDYFGFWNAEGVNGGLSDALLFGMYPGLQYMAFVFAGMAIGRTDILNRHNQIKIIGLGAILAIFGYGVSALVLNDDYYFDSPTYSESGSYSWDGMGTYADDLGYTDGYPGDYSDDYKDPGMWEDIYSGEWYWPDSYAFLSTAPHAGTILETIASGGFAMLVLGICLMLSRFARHVLYPLAAIGSIPLTAYAAHVVAVAFNDEWVFSESYLPFLVVALSAILFACVWRYFFRRGPLEWCAYKIGLLFERTTTALPLKRTEVPLAIAPDTSEDADGSLQPGYERDVTHQ